MAVDINDKNVKNVRLRAGGGLARAGVSAPAARRAPRAK